MVLLKVTKKNRLDSHFEQPMAKQLRIGNHFEQPMAKQLRIGSHFEQPVSKQSYILAAILGRYLAKMHNKEYMCCNLGHSDKTSKELGAGQLFIQFLGGIKQT